MDSKSSFDAYRMPDAMWERIRVILPVYKTGPFGGEPVRTCVASRTRFFTDCELAVSGKRFLFAWRR
jgi:hypothetical protein